VCDWSINPFIKAYPSIATLLKHDKIHKPNSVFVDTSVLSDSVNIFEQVLSTKSDTIFRGEERKPYYTEVE
jgi:hypothetical protein